jgi:hypothetical protein
MTVDIRAKVICRIGGAAVEVISGGWSDDHAQGTGLIRTRGELTVKGLIRTGLGEKVDLAYVQSNYASRFPRSLRVLSAFVDPFRRQTTLQLGCLITLRENRRGQTPPENKAFTWNDPQNAALACAEYAKTSAPIPISAAYIAGLCALRLGLTSDPFPLTNTFTQEEFDLSSGYASVLSDLLVSENYVAYLDAGERLKVVNLNAFTGTTTVIDQSRIIDVSSINSGDIPGESVSITYSYSRYKQKEEDQPDETPEEQSKRNWERDEVIGPAETITIDGRKLRPARFPAQGFVEVGSVSTVSVLPKTTTVTQYDSLDRVIKRTETTNTFIVSTNPEYVRQTSGIQGDTLGTESDLSIRITNFEYARAAGQIVVVPESPPSAGNCSLVLENPQAFDEEKDNVVLSETSTLYVTEMAVAGALDIDYVGPTLFGETAPVWRYTPDNTMADIPAEITTITYEQDDKSGVTKTTTVRQQIRAFTQQGNQVAAGENEDVNLNFAESSTGNTYIESLVERAKQLINVGTTVQMRTDRFYGMQRRPSQTELKNLVSRKPSPGSDGTQSLPLENTSKITFISGSEDAESSTVYRVPYVSDDRIIPLGNGKYVSIPSDAETKARAYGRAQHRLAFGHRNGVSVQLAAPDVPTYPLDKLQLIASGTAALYVSNGTSWSFDSNGIVCNTDALFIGGVGTTELGGSLWFPVQPGITLLGPAPQIYVNEYFEPANSLAVDDQFDPLNVPPTFWDEDLPTDTPAVPQQETDITNLVPAWKEELFYDFTSRSTLSVSSRFLPPPSIQEVSLTVRTSINVLNLDVRYVTLATRCVVSVFATVPAIREAPVECLCAVTFDVFRANISS